MYTFLIVVQVFTAVALIGLILLQHGKGADAGAAFGSGASGTVFGARGSANFLSHSTAILAAVFFITSLLLAYVVQGRRAPTSVIDTQQKTEAPAMPGPAPAQTAPSVPEPKPAQPPQQSKPDAQKPEKETPKVPE
jgi:preprotein translocase subunit SecG